MLWPAAVRSAALAVLRSSKTQLNEVTGQQMRRMAGGGGSHFPVYRSLDGRPPPPEFQGPEFITYAGLTLTKRKPDFDHYLAKAFGALFWFTVLYHLDMNLEEHWHGEIWIFEKDVQLNGWDDVDHWQPGGHHGAHHH